jgi:hypothetical protein
MTIKIAFYMTYFFLITERCPRLPKLRPTYISQTSGIGSCPPCAHARASVPSKMESSPLPFSNPVPDIPTMIVSLAEISPLLLVKVLSISARKAAFRRQDILTVLKFAVAGYLVPPRTSLMSSISTGPICPAMNSSP